MNFFKKNKIFIFLQLIYRGYREYKWRIVMLIFLGFFGGLLEGVGINSIIPLFSFLVGNDPAGSNFIARAMEKIFIFAGIQFSLRNLLIFIIFLFLFRAVVLLISSYIKISTSTRYEEKTRNKLFRLTLNASWAYLLNQKIGHLESLLITNINYSSGLFNQITTAITLLGSLFMYILVAINISFPITLFTIGVGAISLIIFQPLVFRSRLTAQKREILNREIAHFINENIVGMKTLKASFANLIVVEIGKNYFAQLRLLVRKATMLKIYSDAFIQPIGVIFICGIFTFSYKSSNFNLAALVAVIYLIQKIFVYVQQLQGTLHEVNEFTPYLKSILAYEDAVSQCEDVDNGKQTFIFKDSIEFKNVDFYYNQNKKIFSKINFKIKKSEMVGLIGSSGGGKSTLADLILRFFEPTGGEILIDGQNINDFKLKELRLNIGYVSQDAFIKNDTITNNIKFYDETITDEQVEKAAKMADIYDFIMSLPKKFETVVGERGVLFSGGQRQRIVIARVLVRSPQILILDEATSALDNESEIQVQKVIENLKNKVTVLLIAHRLSTVMNCDKLLVLQNGEIKEQGSPKKLLSDEESYFYKVYNLKN